MRKGFFFFSPPAGRFPSSATDKAVCSSSLLPNFTLNSTNTCYSGDTWIKSLFISTSCHSWFFINVVWLSSGSPRTHTPAFLPAFWEHNACSCLTSCSDCWLFSPCLSQQVRPVFNPTVTGTSNVLKTLLTRSVVSLIFLAPPTHTSFWVVFKISPHVKAKQIENAHISTAAGQSARRLKNNKIKQTWRFISVDWRCRGTAASMLRSSTKFTRPLSLIRNLSPDCSAGAVQFQSSQFIALCELLLYLFRISTSVCQSFYFISFVAVRCHKRVPFFYIISVLVSVSVQVRNKCLDFSRKQQFSLVGLLRFLFETLSCICCVLKILCINTY